MEVLLYLIFGAAFVASIWLFRTKKLSFLNQKERVIIVVKNLPSILEILFLGSFCVRELYLDQLEL